MNSSIKVKDKDEPYIDRNVNSAFWLRNRYIAPTVVFTRLQKLSFVSCYAENHVQFGMYSAPFDGATWLGLALAVGAVASFLVGQVVSFGIEVQFVKILCYVWGTLLQQISQLSGKSDNNGSRVLMAVWMLGVCILTNTWTGVVIMTLNAPFPPKYPQEFEVFN